MESFEFGVLDLPDFYFTGDDYRYRFEPEAKQRFLDLLRERFNSVVTYRGCALKWDTVIEQKTTELARILLSRCANVNFEEPAPQLPRVDDRELRAKILALSQSEARRLGIGKSTLWNMKRIANSSRSLRLYKESRKKIDNAQ
jgi:hypothetical protein